MANNVPVDKQQLIAYLKGLSAEQKAAVAKRSYYHANKFCKIVLVKRDDGSSVRLHVWHADPDFVMNPHDHGWRFTSHILHGKLADTHFEQQTDEEKPQTTDKQTTDNQSRAAKERPQATEEKGVKYTRYVMDLTRRDGASHFETGDSVTLAQTGTYVRRVGTQYTLEPHIVHVSQAVVDDTVTLVDQEPITKSSNYVYALRPLVAEEKRASLTSAELETILAHIIQLLSK